MTIQKNISNLQNKKHTMIHFLNLNVEFETHPQ
jgi:hypothetical protein